MNSKSIKKYYSEKGFVVIKDFFSKKQLTDLEDGIIKNAKKILPNLNINSKSYRISNKELNSSLINLKKKNPKIFGSFYDSVQHNAKLYQIFSSEKISKIFKFLNEKKLQEFSITNVGIRMDLPYDKKHKYGWHQDRAYYPQNRNGNNGMLIWTPLSNLFKEVGPLKIKPKSHKLGFIYVKKKQKKNHSPQYSLPKKKLSKFKSISLLIKPRDAAFVNLNTFHASGDNTSKFIRFALQARYSDTTANDFLPFYFKTFYNTDIKKNLENRGWSFKDIQ